MAEQEPAHCPPCAFGELVRVSARIGCLSFGGPAGQIALMHRELVDERGWVTEEDFLHALNFCTLLPGPEAQQLATWIGWKLHGVRGGLAMGLLFILPGAAIMLGLSVLYGLAAHLAWFGAVFLGIKAAVLAIIAEAVVRIGRKALGTALKTGLAVAAFAGLFVFALPFPAVVLGAGLIGTAVAARAPHLLALRAAEAAGPAHARPWRATLAAVSIGGALWALPLALVAATLGTGHVLWQIGTFFSRLAVVTFGGAYAVLAYMAQQAVQGYHWLRPGEMADGLGLAETTPGPLILVTQFVGYLAASRVPEPFTPLVAGVVGAGLTAWVTFVPCFLWIFALAPWMDRIGRSVALRGGLAAITAAVVGVVANLGVWFAIHLLFARVAGPAGGGHGLAIPDPTSFAWRPALLAVLAAVLLLRLRWGVAATLLACGAGGLLLGQIAV